MSFMVRIKMCERQKYNENLSIGTSFTPEEPILKIMVMHEDISQ